jgi:hypothetical protein
MIPLLMGEGDTNGGVAWVGRKIRALLGNKFLWPTSLLTQVAKPIVLALKGKLNVKRGRIDAHE